jgi:hypothetical protein
MPFRRSTRSNNPGSVSKSSAHRRGWIHRLLDGASSAGLAQVPSFRPERLEERRLLTTITSPGAAGTYTFYSGQDQVCQISYSDVTFEAVGVVVDPKTGAAALGDLVPAATPEPAVGANIYKIYVTQSNADSYISVYTVDSITTLNPTPFAGAIPTFTIINTAGQIATATVPAGTGGVLIGALDPIVPQGIPAPTQITEVQMAGPIGLQPVPASGFLTPGIEVVGVNASGGTQNNFGSILIGGTVTGTVSIGGNINTFYAGSVLTGDVDGDGLPPAAAPTSARVAPDNFHVAGDIRQFMTTGPVGTDGTGSAAAPNYITNFDLSVGGKIGEVKVGNNEKGDGTSAFAGTIEAGNSPYISQQLPYPAAAPAGSVNLIGNTTAQTEVETLTIPNPDTVWATGGLDLRNDTPADAEFLATVPTINAATNLPVRDAHGNIVYTASVTGNLDLADGDANDYYAVGLLAGQTIQVSLSANTLDVYDPDGRMIASNALSGAGPLQFTADRPGIYLFEVTGTAGGGYTLNVAGVPEQGIGGIAIGSWCNDVGIDSSIIVGNADLGAIEVGGTYYSSTTGPTPTTAGTTLPTGVTPPVAASTSIAVANGNLNALVAGTLGVLDAATLTVGGGPYLSVPNGSVGLVQSTTGEMDLETQFDPNYLTEATPIHKTDDAYATAIGGSIQVIDAATTFQGDLAVNGGIGTLRAGNMDTNAASYIDVNADNKGSDGIIDLMDINGQVGTAAAGGPDIVTNEGGDLRYFNVPTTAAIFRPLMFGGGVDTAVTYPAGQAARFTDGAGNQLTIGPEGLVTTTVVTTVNTPSANSSNTTSTTTTTTTSVGPQITVLSYPLVDKAGQVPISITSTGGMTITDSGANGSEVNIAQLGIAGAGSPIVNNGTDQFGNTQIEQTPPTTNASSGTTTTSNTTTNADGSTTTVTTNVSGGGTTTYLDLNLGGPEVINVLNTTVTGNATSIINNTLGEMASITAPNVGQILVHGNLGFTTPRATAAAVYPRAVITGGNVYPFLQQHTGVVITGDAVDIDAYGAIGNVQVTGTLETLIPNFGVTTHQYHASAIPGQVDGIVGPIVGGNLLNIDVGQGLLPTGSGAVGYSGIFATATIGLVDNYNNPNGDIRGNILSANTAGTGYGIGEISLTNASIIGATIGIAAVDGVAAVQPTQSPFASPYIYQIGSIVVTGLGGIVGASISATDVGPIVVSNGGFGVLETTIASQAVGRVAGITASGYGIRNVTINGGGYVGQIVATGGGPTISVLTYPIDVRESDQIITAAATTEGFAQVDPFFDVPAVATIDLNAALGTTAEQPNIPDVTDTGVVADCVFEGQESFAGLTAQKVRTNEPLFTDGTTEPTPPVLNIPVIGTNFPMEINFGAGVGPIRVFQQTDGLQITTGHLLGFFPGTSVSRVGISVTGPINTLHINGDFGQIVTDPQTGAQMPDSYINAGGPSGTIGSLYIKGDLNGTVSATGTIGSIFVGHDVEAGIIALGQTTGLALGSLHVQGGIRDGALVLNGSVGSIVVNGTLGTSTASLTIQGNANLISVGAWHALKNSDLALALTVGGYLRNLTVFGTISGSVNVGGDLTNLRVTGSGAATVIVTGSISVGGRIQTAVINGGSVGGSIIASNSIGSFTINKGSLLVPAIVESQIAGIGFFRITGGLAYGLYGSLLAQSGQNDRIDISGNLGDGVNTATVTALSGTTFRIRGTIADHANVQVAGQLNLLEVDGDIQTGAVVAAHPLLKQKIKGSDTGSVTIV